MNFAKKTILLLVLLSIISGSAGAQETEDSSSEKKAFFPALLGIFMTDVVLHTFSWLNGEDYAEISPQSWKNNLLSRWWWDDDPFLYNHPGHAYQGGLYHAAARTNGFSFYESLLFGLGGSLTWELFGETDEPAINDLIFTPIAGAAFGEMMHLLYLEIGNPWLAALVSPIDAFNNLLLGKKPTKTYNTYYLSTMAGPGWIKPIYRDNEQQDSLTKPQPSNIFSGNIGCEVIYGNPFDQNSKKPFSHFEFKLLFGITFLPTGTDWTILNDAFLFSYNPLYTEKDMLSTGLTLHYDVFASNLINFNFNFANNGLDWSLKWRHEFNTAHLELKSHLGWTILGSSEYFPLIEKDLNLRERDNYFGTGANLKFFVTFVTQKKSRITLGTCNYLVFMIPYLNKPDSRTIEFINFSFLECSFRFTKIFSLFVNNSFFLKSVHSYKENNAVYISNRLILGIQMTFIDK
ncbi:MAG: DUF3943 domain-containing protein [Treponema sp.]|jgi:hypothetical protein|nr:DUF3943 domain-containing protein [Treponema sp.]